MKTKETVNIIHKLYLVRFTIEGKRVYKPGITRHTDVTKRFQRSLDDGTISDFKIMKSSYFESEEEAYKAEQNLFEEIKTKFGGYEHKDGVTRFHNLWIQNKYGGITEIRKYNQDEVNHCWKYIDNNGAPSHWMVQKNILI